MISPPLEKNFLTLTLPPLVDTHFGSIRILHTLYSKNKNKTQRCSTRWLAPSPASSGLPCNSREGRCVSLDEETLLCGPPLFWPWVLASSASHPLRRLMQQEGAGLMNDVLIRTRGWGPFAPLVIPTVNLPLFILTSCSVFLLIPWAMLFGHFNLVWKPFCCVTSGIASWLVSLMAVAKVAPPQKQDLSERSIPLSYRRHGKEAKPSSTRIPSLLSLKSGQSQINKIK